MKSQAIRDTVPTPLTSAPPPHPTVLLVEDNPDDELLALRALRPVRGCLVRTARDGAEAVDYLRERPVLPRLVLLDLKLPRLNGLEVLSRIRGGLGMTGIPVVILSSSKEQVDVRESYRLGANSFIQKPIEFDEYVETVRLVGQYWLTKNLRPE